MALFSRHTFALLAIWAYVSGTALVDFAHHNHADFLLESNPVLSSHDCGAKEIHIPLDQVRHCLACSQFTQRFSADIVSRCTFDAAIVCMAVVPWHAEQTIETDILYTGKRGPPFA